MQILSKAHDKLIFYLIFLIIEIELGVAANLNRKLPKKELANKLEIDVWPLTHF